MKNTVEILPTPALDSVSLLRHVITASTLLAYFRGYEVLSREEEEEHPAHVYIYHANPAAALLLPGFFHKQLGLDVGNNVYERVIPESAGKLTYGLEISNSLISMNHKSLAFIASHFEEYIDLLRQLWRCQGVLNITLKENLLQIVSSEDTHMLLRSLPGSRTLMPQLSSQTSGLHALTIAPEQLLRESSLLTQMCASLEDAAKKPTRVQRRREVA